MTGRTGSARLRVLSGLRSSLLRTLERERKLAPDSHVAPKGLVRSAAPARVAELGMFLVVRGLAISDQMSSLALALISWVLLPVLAGFRVARAGGNLLLASGGGLAVSGVTLACAALSELFITRDARALGGLVLATLFVAAPTQALSGLVAGWAAIRRAGGGA